MSPPDTTDAPEAPDDMALPDGACDCHVHVIGAPEAWPMVADRHYTPGPAPPEALRRHMAALGLQRAVIVQPSVYGTDNRCMLDALDRLDGAGRGVAVPPQDVAPAALRHMHACGVRGVRINLESAGSHDVAMLEALLGRWSGRIADLGWHVQLYAAPDVVAALADQLAALPTRVVLDHFALMAQAPGADGPGTAITDLLRTGRVLVKLSAPYRLPSPTLAAAWARAFVEASPTSVLWGSDWPHTARQPEAGRLGVSAYRRIAHGELAAAVRAWLPSPDLRRLVLVDTPADLYDF
jgi:predicted TIM-barrel fold metal-dependent hydrolase